MSKRRAPQQPANPNPDWQDRDIRLKGVVISLAIVASVTVFSFLAMDALFGRYDKKERAQAAEVSPLARVREIPPGPLLQVAPRDELAEHRRVQASFLHTYQWIDMEAGIARIPIERAVSILADRGLPAREQAGEEE